MTHRDPEVRATNAAASYRIQLRSAENTIERQAAAIAELQRSLILSLAGEFLVAPEEFERNVDRHDILTDDLVDVHLLELQARDLIRRKPYLAKSDMR